MRNFGNTKLVGLLVILILVIGVFVTVVASRQQTQTQQHASGFIDLNRGESITQTNNSDGTMGPYLSAGNYSNTLSQSQLGSVTFMVTDPAQQQGKPALPTHIPPANGAGRATTAVTSLTPAAANGPQSVKSLIIKIRKVEVHLAYLALTKGATPTPADHWETLDMAQPISVDLVQLSQGGVAPLGLTKLAAGKYTEVRLYIESATATLSSGNDITLNTLGKDSTVKVVQPFTIDAGKNTTLIMDFDAQNSVIANANGYILKPVVARFLENQ